MKISSETSSEEVKCATLQNIDKIPNVEIVYPHRKSLSHSNDNSNQYWLNKVCNKKTED